MDKFVGTKAKQNEKKRKRLLIPKSKLSIKNGSFILELNKKKQQRKTKMNQTEFSSESHTGTTASNFPIRKVSETQHNNNLFPIQPKVKNGSLSVIIKTRTNMHDLLRKLTCYHKIKR